MLTSQCIRILYIHVYDNTILYAHEVPAAWSSSLLVLYHAIALAIPQCQCTHITSFLLLVRLRATPEYIICNPADFHSWQIFFPPVRDTWHTSFMRSYKTCSTGDRSVIRILLLANMTFGEILDLTAEVIFLYIPVSYTHLTLPTKA